MYNHTIVASIDEWFYKSLLYINAASQAYKIAVGLKSLSLKNEKALINQQLAKEKLIEKKM